MEKTVFIEKSESPSTSALDRLGFPISDNRYPDPAITQMANLAWARECGLVLTPRESDHLAETQSASLSCFTFPYAPAKHRLVAANLIAWLFVWDDRYPDGKMRRDRGALRRVCDNYLDVVRRERTGPRTPLGTALLSIWDQLREVGDRAWLDQMLESLELYFEGCCEEVEWRVCGEYPTLDEYIAFRHKSVGCYQMVDLIETCGACRLPHQASSHPDIVDLRKKTVTMLALTNDGYSSVKEFHEDSSFNAVSCIAREHGLSYLEALELYARVHRERLAEFLAGVDKVKSRTPRESPEWRFADLTRLWVQGNRDWSATVPRYTRATISTLEQRAVLPAAPRRPS